MVGEHRSRKRPRRERSYRAPVLTKRRQFTLLAAVTCGVPSDPTVLWIRLRAQPRSLNHNATDRQIQRQSDRNGAEKPLSNVLGGTSPFKARIERLFQAAPLTFQQPA
jgi:hypothetical protein